MCQRPEVLIKNGKAFFVKRKKDVILVLEVEVNCSRGIFNLLGNISNGRILKPFLHEQFFSGLKDFPFQFFLLTFFSGWLWSFFGLDILLNGVKLLIVSEFQKKILSES